MIPALQASYRDLEEAKSIFLGRLDALSDAQLAFRVTPEAWTPLQVGQHVLSAEQRSVDVLVRLKGQPNGRRNLRQRVLYGLVGMVLKLGIKVKNPTRVNPDGKLTLEELRSQWGELRTRLEEHLEPLEAADLERAGFKHPVSGPLNLEEGMRFLNQHIRHHLRQLDRISDSPEFPNS